MEKQKRYSYKEALEELRRISAEYTKKTGYKIIGFVKDKVIIKNELVEIVRLGDIDTVFFLESNAQDKKVDEPKDKTV